MTEARRSEPHDAVEVIVNKTGQVFARLEGQLELQDLGQLTLATFANEAGLAPMGDNLFRETVDSGQPAIGTPGAGGLGHVIAGSIEQSNVALAQEFIDLISSQRAFQANARVITSSDTILNDLISIVR